jgi:hypothetical protein
METNNNIKFNCEKCSFKCRFVSQWIKHIETELHKTGIKKSVLTSKNLINVMIVYMKQKI